MNVLVGLIVGVVLTIGSCEIRVSKRARSQRKGRKIAAADQEAIRRRTC